MNILWIEDNERISDLEKKFFLKSESFDGKLHNLVIPKNFDEAIKEISNALNEYDYIILDINLENFEIGEEGKLLFEKFPNIKSRSEFMLEAGFHLYLKLIPQGFRKERIVFLTGNTNENKISSLLWQFQKASKNKNSKNAEEVLDSLRKQINENEYDKITNLINKRCYIEVVSYWEKLVNDYEISEKAENTYDVFKKHFLEARLPLPFSIHKDNNEDFYAWLDGNLLINESNSYILLRRSIIESCIELTKTIENNDFNELLIFNKTLTNKSDPLTKDEVVLFLNKIKNFFPLNPPENRDQLYYSFVRELSAFWEKSKGYLKRSDLKSDDNVEFNFMNFCQNQMKLLRNWTAHDQLSNVLSEKEIAFYYMVTARALFNLDVNTIIRYENLMFSIFSQREFTNEKIVRNLSDSYRRLRGQYGRNQNPSRSEFNGVLNEVWQQKKFQKEHSKRYFYQNFFHSLQPAILKLVQIEKREKYRKLHEKVIITINFNFPVLKKYKFLDKLASSIYNSAFEK